MLYRRRYVHIQLVGIAPHHLLVGQPCFVHSVLEPHQPEALIARCEGSSSPSYIQLVLRLLSDLDLPLSEDDNVLGDLSLLLSANVGCSK